VEVLERLEGHYDAQEVPFGVVYRWCPECVVVECKCGKRLTLKRANSATRRRPSASVARTAQTTIKRQRWLGRRWWR
jgi:hypothetical protein